eukprot:Gb_01262 [translate_table: standard]
MIIRSNTKLIVESMMPDFLHIIPIANNSVLNWVLEGQNTTLGLCFVSNICIFLTHSYHHTSVPWTTYYTWENCSWSIISCKSSLHRPRSIVTNNCLGFFTVLHDQISLDSLKKYNCPNENRYCPIQNFIT